jgi:hypothetical protein
MFITTVDQDPLEYQAILRRRRIEEERKKRIFNPRQRCIGV